MTQFKSLTHALSTLLPALAMTAGAALSAACVEAPEDHDDSLGVQASALTLQPTEAGRRAAVVMEAARAVFGPNAMSNPPWPSAGEQKALFRYPTEDAGAWNLLVGAYSTTSGHNDVSCRNPDGTYDEPCKYLEIIHGPVDRFKYTCQAAYGTTACPESNPPASTYYRGGQCHAFANLVLYRSGQYQGASYAFKKLPSSPYSAPYVTPSSLKVGDVLRRIGTGQHTMIVVKILDQAAMKVVVVDSNWIGVAYSERYGARVYTIPAGTYRDLDCVYTGGC